MDRKAVARETLGIMERGYYEFEGKRVDVKVQMEQSISGSLLFSPEQGKKILEKYGKSTEDPGFSGKTRVENISAVDAVRRLTEEGRTG